MAASHSAQKAGERVEELLAELGAQAGPQAAATAEELVASLVEFYGAGLAEIVQIISQDVEAGKRLMTKLAADPLVESLLLLHDLHPLPIADRVRRAINAVMPQLGAHAGQAEFAGLDEAAWSGSGWSSATMAARPTPERCRRPSSRRWPTPHRTRRASVSTWSPRPPSCRCCRSAGPRPPGGRGDQPGRSSGLRRFAKRQAWPHPGLPPAIQQVLAERAAARGRDDGAGADADRCEMCAEVLGERHGHVVDLENRSLACTCRACYLLFTHDGAAGGRYRAVPEYVYHDPDRPLTDLDWGELQIPVAMAFFFYNSELGRVVAGYPSPGGVTECELDLAAWDRLADRPPAAGRARARRRGHPGQPERRPQ